MPQLLHFLRVDRRTHVASSNNSNCSKSDNRNSNNKSNQRLETINEMEEKVEETEKIDKNNGKNNKNEKSQKKKSEKNGNSSNEFEEEMKFFENKADEDIDWGTIDVYTCTASCSVQHTRVGGSIGSSGGSDSRSGSGSGSAYIEESTYVQKPLAFVKTSVLPALPMKPRKANN